MTTTRPSLTSSTSEVRSIEPVIEPTLIVAPTVGAVIRWIYHLLVKSVGSVIRWRRSVGITQAGGGISCTCSGCSCWRGRGGFIGFGADWRGFSKRVRSRRGTWPMQLAAWPPSPPRAPRDSRPVRPLKYLYYIYEILQQNFILHQHCCTIVRLCCTKPCRTLVPALVGNACVRVGTKTATQTESQLLLSKFITRVARKSGGYPLALA